MIKQRINIKKLLAPTDSVSIVVIIVGLLIAIALSELAIRLIGVSVAILGSVALFLQISTRMRDFVGSKYKPSTPPPNFKVTDIKDKSARRQVIEDYNATFGPEEKYMKEKIPEPVKELTQSPMDTNEDLEFRIVGKAPASPRDEAPREIPDAQIVNEEPTPKLSMPVVDDFSEMRIIGKKPADVNQTDTPALPESTQFIDEEPEIPDESNAELPHDEEVLTSTKPEETEDAPKSITITFDDETEEPVIRERPQIQSDDLSQKANELIGQIKEKQSELFPHKGIIPQSRITKDFKEKLIDIPMNTLVDDVQLTGQEPKKEFEYFLNRVLILIRSVTSTKTAAFFLVNMEKHELILESFVTDVPDAITTKQKLPLRNDVVSQIVMNVKPEILSEINPSAETDLIPYYTRSVGTASFIGVPVFFNNAVIGILCADSQIVDAYDTLTVGFLGHFTKLIGGLVQSYTEKYELMQASRTLNAINSFRKVVSTQNLSLNSIADSVVEASSKILDYSMLGIVCFDDNLNSWKIFSIKAKIKEPATNLKNYKIDIQNSLIGKAITTGKTIFASPLKEDQIRVHVRELKMNTGFFAAVPMKSLNNTYGAIFVEGRTSSAITQNDIQILETLAENAGTNVEHLLFLDMFQNSSMVDSATGMLNPAAFFSRLDEEIIKSHDFKSALTLCLFQIDNYAALDPVQYRERNEKVYYHVLNIIKNRLKPYHIIGRADDNIFGIVLSGMSVSDAHRLMERIRQEIARSFVEISKKRYNVTASFGLAEVSRNDNLESLVTNSQRVLDISLQKSNAVSVFE